ncbi:ubiquitin carboxyl-terminal hydrolase CYLD-like isoform X1 [Pelobates cultripes]|nr:ubiquitin carboxyl-terminal hydrolase CYLD-like isoform X1 [Pelobates cultripes]
MSSMRYYLATHDFSALPESIDGVYETVEKGSMLTPVDAPPTAVIRVDDPKHSPTPLWLRVQETQRVVGVAVESVIELEPLVGRILLAVTDTEERLAFFKDRRRMREVIELKPRDCVRVQVTSSSGRKEKGVLHYRGLVSHRQGILFGVQLVGSAVGKGFTDGSFLGQRFFQCNENCGVFVPGSRLEREPNESSSRRMRNVEESNVGRPEEPVPGPRRTNTRAVELPVEPRPKQLNFLSRGVRQQSPPRAGEKEQDNELGPVGEGRSAQRGVPEENTIQVEEEPKPFNTPLEISDSQPSSHSCPEDHRPPSSLYCPPKNGDHTSLLPEATFPMQGLELNSMVEVDDPPIYGVIRWIGQTPESAEPIAGLEMEEEMSSGCTDGMYRGNRCFECGPNKALFVKLKSCRPDSRFSSLHGRVNQIQRCNSIAFQDYASKCVEENTPPAEGNEAIELLTGWKKGIQGHCNSCYLDATLFCMFACSSVLDTMLLRPSDKNDNDSYTVTRDLLRTEIVNPLRKNGYVCATKIMALRKILEAAGRSTGFTNEEKDPEEFLTNLFQVLRAEPLFYIRISKKKPQGCLFYQIFMERKLSVNMPSVQQLLEWSMVTGDLKFTEAPSCLIIQMPRNGKNFKMFPTIIPTVELNITDLLEDTPRQCCICQSLAEVECQECYEDVGITPGHIKQYCDICNAQVHLHKQRKGHQPRQLHFPKDISGQVMFQRQSMELFAVLCIETSHYVAFVRLNSQKRPLWVFFDSMADREGGENGFNIPRVTPCPEVSEYLEMTPEQLQKEDLKTMPTYVRRLFCDAYMCLYYSPDLSLYK